MIAQMKSGTVQHVGIQSLLGAVLAALMLAGCADTSIKKQWKSPAHTGGPVQKVAIVAVDNRGLVRQGFENRFARALGANGGDSVVSHEVMGLEEMKADKTAAAKAMKDAGADSVLIVRLVDQVSYNRQVRATPALFAETITGVGGYYGWYDYYSVAFMDMGTVWSSTTQEVYLDTTLYSLEGQRLWSALTKTTVKETADRLVEADALTAKVVAAMRQDGVVR
jgi:hypothetical protein